MNRVSDCPENWRAVPDWPDYRVSNRGGVLRIDRETGEISEMPVPEVWPSGDRVIPLLSGKKIRIYQSVQWLVASAFLLPAPSAGHVVRHRNGNRSDNRVLNLEWVPVGGNRFFN